jgi:hypothetical protein
MAPKGVRRRVPVARHSGKQEGYVGGVARGRAWGRRRRWLALHLAMTAAQQRRVQIRCCVAAACAEHEQGKLGVGAAWSLPPPRCSPLSASTSVTVRQEPRAPGAMPCPAPLIPAHEVVVRLDSFVHCSYDSTFADHRRWWCATARGHSPPKSRWGPAADSPGRAGRG